MILFSITDKILKLFQNFFAHETFFLDASHENELHLFCEDHQAIFLLAYSKNYQHAYWTKNFLNYSSAFTKSVFNVISFDTHEQDSTLCELLQYACSAKNSEVGTIFNKPYDFFEKDEKDYDVLAFGNQFFGIENALFFAYRNEQFRFERFSSKHIRVMNDEKLLAVLPFYKIESH